MGDQLWRRVAIIEQSLYWFHWLLLDTMTSGLDIVIDGICPIHLFSVSFLHMPIISDWTTWPLCLTIILLTSRLLRTTCLMLSDVILRYQSNYLLNFTKVSSMATDHTHWFCIREITPALGSHRCEYRTQQNPSATVLRRLARFCWRRKSILTITSSAALKQPYGMTLHRLTFLSACSQFDVTSIALPHKTETWVSSQVRPPTNKMVQCCRVLLCVMNPMPKVIAPS